eukprot:3955923-Prymnesium_polylepis.2
MPDFCFAKCSSCDEHVAGNWVPRTQPPPYRLTAETWAAIGVRAMGYNQCDLVSETNGVARKLFDWSATGCTMRRWDVASTCAALRGKTIMMVGDSLAGQQFLSLTAMLGGKWGQNMQSRALTDVTSSVCGGSARIIHVRNDLVLWSMQHTDFARVTSFDGSILLAPWIQRASREADILVIGSGHHFPHMGTKLAAKQGPEMAQARVNFPLRSLNYTLTNAVQARKRWGHLPESTILLSAPAPTKTCRRYQSPLSIHEALGAFHSDDVNASDFRADLVGYWNQMYQQNAQTRWVTKDLGASFIDIAPLSIRRPDGMMAHYIKMYDCLHSCLPGPLDVWSELIFHVAQRLASTPAGSSSRVFTLNESVWLAAGSSRAFEYCKPQGAESDCAVTPPRLSGLQWWPFRNYRTVEKEPSSTAKGEGSSGGQRARASSRKQKA